MTKQFIIFIVVGGIAAIANFCSRIYINHWLSYSASIWLAYLIGMITAFVLNRIFVFSTTSNRLHQQIFWFTIVNLVAVLQTWIISLLLARHMFPWMGFTWHPETVAHAFGVATPVITSYFGHKYLSFRQASSTPASHV
jgi:putative flippase GtrA